MKSSIIISLFIFFALICSISSAYAEDLNETELNSDEVVIDEINFEEKSVNPVSIVICDNGDKNSNITLNFEVLENETDVCSSDVSYPECVSGNALVNAENCSNIMVFKKNHLVDYIIVNDSQATFNGLLSASNDVVNYNDGNYLSSFDSSSFTVSPDSSDINVEPYSNITCFDNITFNISLINGSSGSYQLNKGNSVVKRGFLSNTLVFYSLSAGNYSLTIYNNGDSNHISSSKTIYFTVFKITPSITISKIADRTYGNSVNVSFSIDNGLSGEFNVSVYKSNVLIASEVVSTNYCTFDLLDSASYEVVVTYLGSDNYSVCSKSATFNILKLQSSVKIRLISSLVYGGYSYASFNLVNGTGTYELLLDGKTIQTGGISSAAGFGYLQAGSYTLNAVNNGDVNHASSKDSISFTIRKANSKITIDPISNVYYLSNVTVGFSLNNGLSNNVNASLSKDKIVVQSKIISNREIIFSNLDAGDYELKIQYPGDENYIGSFETAKFTVFKASSSVSINNVSDIVYGESLKINISYINASYADYYLISDVNITGTTSGIVEFSNLASGNYTLIVINNGDKNHELSQDSANFTVYKADPQFSVAPISKVYWNENINITYSISKLTTGHVNVTFLGNVTSYDLFEKINITNLKSGNYSVVFTYSGDKNFTNASQNIDFEIMPVVSYVFINTEKNCEVESSGHNYTLTYKGKTMDIRVFTDSIIVNGKIYEGINNLRIYNYEFGFLVRVQAVIDDCYGESNFSDSIKINALSICQIVGANNQIYFSLPSDATGTVDIYINNNHYYLRLANGQANLNLNSLPNGVYSYLISYSGDIKYGFFITHGNSVIYHNVFVKSTPKIKASNKVFKLSKKAKKYEITLSTVAKAKVTLKIDKKTYKATTDSKGKATFKINFKKAKTYKAEINFAGNDYFNGVSKTVKFKVKKVGK